MQQPDVKSDLLGLFESCVEALNPASYERALPDSCQLAVKLSRGRLFAWANFIGLNEEKKQGVQADNVAVFALAQILSLLWGVVNSTQNSAPASQTSYWLPLSELESSDLQSDKLHADSDTRGSFGRSLRSLVDQIQNHTAFGDELDRLVTEIYREEIASCNARRHRDAVAAYINANSDCQLPSFRQFRDLFNLKELVEINKEPSPPLSIDNSTPEDRSGAVATDLSTACTHVLVVSRRVKGFDKKRGSVLLRAFISAKILAKCDGLLPQSYIQVVEDERMPPSNGNHTSLQSLHHILGKEQFKPGLTQKVTLAQNLALLLQLLHTVDTVHHGLHGHNVLFRIIANECDHRRPILSAFAVPRSATDNVVDGSCRPELNICEWSSTQSLTALQGSRQIMDTIYNLGLLLLHIALWRQLPENKSEPSNRMLDEAANLRFTIVDAYCTVVMRCLNGYGKHGLGIEQMQNEKEPAAALEIFAAFNKRVVEPLLRIDI